ncbi:hypothetical protein, partial [Catenulispora pinistramenti]|uniref:hypothetical protein n=1 Tax=Catenulispora pinistramenti TaxID=2705254 RepID=UPI001E5A1B5C
MTSSPSAVTMWAVPSRTSFPSPPTISAGGRGVGRPPACSAYAGTARHQPLRAVTDQVYVEFRRFDLEDADPANIEEPPSSHRIPRENLTVRQGIVYMWSPGHTHKAIVTMQAWAEEPARQPDKLWEFTADSEVVLRSGTIRVNSRGHERMRGLEGGGLEPEEGEQYRPGEEYLF